MAKIVRKNQKIFGSSAGGLQIGVVGSLAAGSVDYSTDPDDIQSLSEFLDGLFSVVLGGNSPAIEDINALYYLFTYQLAYLMQAGVAEWNDETTYYIGSFASDGIGGVYYSSTDNNLNNALSDRDNWVPLTGEMQEQIDGNTVAAGNIATRQIQKTSTTVPALSFKDIVWSLSLKLFASVASSSSASSVMTSPDGITWTGGTLPNAVGYRFLGWAPSLGLFIAVSGNGNTNALSSTDGTTWTARTMPSTVSGSTAGQMAWSPSLGMMVLVVAGGSDQIFTTTNGTSWTARTKPNANQWACITWSEELGLFAAGSISAGSTTNIMTSPDGITWTARTTVTGDQIYGIVWNPDERKFVAMTSQGNIYTSVNGTSWTQVAITPVINPGQFMYLSAFRMYYVSAANASKIYTSTDLVNWYSRDTNSATGFEGNGCACEELSMFLFSGSDSGGQKVFRTN